ncbi:MAG: hypothetical protein ACOYL3_10470 [Desulfuromonadaceae bacterium]
MSTFNDEMSLKLAWQTAYQLRTCPDEETLYSENIDDNLQKHLSICHACREKRAMDPEERKAWETLQAKFAGATIQPATDIAKQTGQVWMLGKSCGGWRDDGRFINQPSVLLLENIPPASWKVAQLYHDKRLMGAGDVLINGRFGFAEGWNCYVLRDDRLDCCLGAVSAEVIERVLAASMVACEPAEEGSFLSLFRMTETEVRSFVAVRSVMELAHERKTITEAAIELIPGLKLSVSGARDFVLDIAAGTLDLLRGTFRPALVLRGVATQPESQKLTDEHKMLLQEQCPVVPVSLDISGSVLTIQLKWLQQKPLEPSAICLVINGLELPNVEIIDVGKDAVKITCSHDVIAAVGVQELRSMRLVENSDVLIIYLEF